MTAYVPPGELIIVTAPRASNYSGLGNSSGDGAGGLFDSADPFLGGEGSTQGGRSDRPDKMDFQFDKKCQSETDTAAEIAKAIRATDDPYGPKSYDWTNTEYLGVILKDRDGKFGASGARIYSDGKPRGVNLAYPALSNGETAAGLIHNHPAEGRNDEELMTERYPSQGDRGSSSDWDTLAQFSSRYGIADPTMWIIDSMGAVRGFKLSERNKIERLSNQHKLSGINLPPENTSSGC
jgi:hypothetical protein